MWDEANFYGCRRAGEAKYSPYSRRVYLGEDEGSWSLVFHFCDLTAWSDASEPVYAPGVPVLKWEPSDAPTLDYPCVWKIQM